jgi:hypothetical protein
MKRKILVALSGLALAAPSHALVGIAVSGGLNSTSISGADQNIGGGNVPKEFAGDSLVATRTKVSNLTQVGVKAWLELPVLPIEIEVADNIAWGSYQSSLTLYSPSGVTKIPVDIPSPFLGLGSKSGSTPYLSNFTDITLRYPILQLPPLSPIQPLKIWIGGGLTNIASTRIIDQSDLQTIYGSGTYNGNPNDARSTLEKNLWTNTIGGHLAVGAQLKIPVIPIALFIDGKWYIHTSSSSAVSKYPLAINAGAGFSI